MSGDGDSPADAPDYRQAALALVAVVGLLVAGFVAPPVGDAGGNEAGGGTVTDVLADLLEWLFDGGGSPECRITLNSRPVPGQEVTATVTEDGRPVVGAVVWFNDRRVGRTDERGRVTGRVPYERTLRVRVRAPGLEGCGRTVGYGGAVPEGVSLSGGTAGVVSPAGAAGLAAAAAADADRRQRAGRNRSAPDETVTYTVQGRVRIAVSGEPYPGETVRIRATIEGVAMPRATVTIDGERVGRTDAEGEATIRIPEETRRVTVRVSRGDFSGTRVIEVLLLEATLRPDGPVLVPRGAATLVATVGGDPVAGAVVRVDGERVGTTNANGRLPLVLPADPTAEVTVVTDRQTTSVSLLGLYWLPGSVALMAVVTLTGGAYRRHGRRGAATVLGVVAAVLTALLAAAYLDGIAETAALAVVGLAVGSVALARWRRPVGAAARRGVARIRAVDEPVVALVRWVVAWLEGVLIRAADLRQWLRTWLATLPRSVPALVRRFTAGVRRAAVAAADALWTSATGAAVAAVLALAAGYLLAGTRGAAAVAAALLLAGAWWLFARRSTERTGGPGTRSEGAFRAEDDAAGGAAGPARRSLRQLWRTFAARVAPGNWRTRTPAEVARMAVAQGYPQRPVDELAAAFRAVEYGSRSPTETLRQRAREAFDALVGSEPDREDDTTRTAKKPDPDDGQGGADHP